MFKKIMLATDGSQHSMRAAENAIHIAKCSEESTIEIIYVFDPDRAKSETLSNWNTSEIEDKRKKRLSEVEEMVKNSEVTYHITVLDGDPGPTIVDYVNKNGADLVIIGSRGLNALQELVLGSVSHKVAKRANCPVLIVK